MAQYKLIWPQIRITNEKRSYIRVSPCKLNVYYIKGTDYKSAPAGLYALPDAGADLQSVPNSGIQYSVPQYKLIWPQIRITIKKRGYIRVPQ